MAISSYGSRALAACAVAGALAAGNAATADTDWDALRTSDWGAKTAQDGNKLAQAAGGTGGDWSAEIQKAFVDLGMAAPRAECYGRVLAESLSSEQQEEAARLVRESATAGDVKTNVITGGPGMVGGFSAADAACPESMGG